MAKEKTKTTQWHPLFAELLRPMLQDYYDVQTNVPVGDAPRAADILLLRRKSDQTQPFRGLWRHLTAWNVLEFKGPSVSARLRDFHLLVELGLGIDRRLNEERTRQREAIVEPEVVSFWYVARNLGARLLKDARLQFGQLEEVESGLWSSQVLRHPVYLISSETRGSEPDSVPLHLLVQRPQEQEHELAQLVIEQPHFLEWYGSVFSILHPNESKEVSKMVAKQRKGLHWDFSAVIEEIGMEKLVQSLGLRQVMEAVGPEKVIGEMGVDWLLSNLSPADLKKLKERVNRK